MKFSPTFLKDLHEISKQAFIEKNHWVGKLVPEIICDNLKERGVKASDIEGVVVLTVEEAKLLSKALDCLEADVEGIDETSQSLIKSRCARYHLEERIKQAEANR